MPYLRTKNELPIIPGYASGDIVTISDAFPGSPVNKLTAAVSGIGCNICNVTDNVSYFNGLTKGIYGFVDMGTLSYARNASYGMSSTGIKTYVKKPATVYSTIKAIISDNYINGTFSQLTSAGTSGSYFAFYTDGSFCINTTETDPTAFRTAMSGVYLIYELETPTTPTITPTQYNTLLTAFEYDGYMLPITFPSSVSSGSITINSDGSVDLTSEGTTTRLTDTAQVTMISGLNNIWVDTGDIDNLVYIRRLES